MEKVYKVYCYTSPSGKKYVGVTAWEKMRKRSHARNEWILTLNNKFACAIRKYGFDSFKYEVLFKTTDKEKASKMEEHYITLFDCVKNGYNIAPGGYNNNSGLVTHSEDVVKNVIQDLKENKLTYKQISKKHGISQCLISNIRNGNMRNQEKIERSNMARVGSSNPTSKLNEEIVKNIKNDLANGVSRKELQIRYGVSKTLIQKIATEEIWNHVKADYVYERKELNGNAKLNKEIVSNIKRDIKNGIRVLDLVTKYGISEATIYQIKQGRTWKDVE